MFGELSVVQVMDLKQPAEDVGATVDGAVARLLDVADHPKIARWVQLPKALFIFLILPDDPESGAFYVYDRNSRVWFWVDFDDEKFGGYNVNDCDVLMRDCRFLDIVETPYLLAGSQRWIVQPGRSPERVHVQSGPREQRAMSAA